MNIDYTHECTDLDDSGSENSENIQLKVQVSTASEKMEKSSLKNKGKVKSSPNVVTAQLKVSFLCTAYFFANLLLLDCSFLNKQQRESYQKSTLKNWRGAW